MFVAYSQGETVFVPTRQLNLKLSIKTQTHLCCKKLNCHTHKSFFKLLYQDIYVF